MFFRVISRRSGLLSSNKQPLIYSRWLVINDNSIGLRLICWKHVPYSCDFPCIRKNAYTDKPNPKPKIVRQQQEKWNQCFHCQVKGLHPWSCCSFSISQPNDKLAVCLQASQLLDVFQAKHTIEWQTLSAISCVSGTKVLCLAFSWLT